MSEGSDIVCFHCGQSVGDPPRLNHRPDGEPCRCCADRLLDSLPPIFHAPLGEPAEASRGVGEDRPEEEASAKARGPEGRPSGFEDDQPA